MNFLSATLRVLIPVFSLLLLSCGVTDQRTAPPPSTGATGIDVPREFSQGAHRAAYETGYVVARNDRLSGASQHVDRHAAHFNRSTARSFRAGYTTGWIEAHTGPGSQRGQSVQEAYREGYHAGVADRRAGNDATPGTPYQGIIRQTYERGYREGYRHGY